jgi:hypothetical protein
MFIDVHCGFLSYPTCYDSSDREVVDDVDDLHIASKAPGHSLIWTIPVIE